MFCAPEVPYLLLATAVSLLLASYLLHTCSGATSADPEAAFPTAQWAAAMRACDACSAAPQIGANVGGGPDLAAQHLAGETGALMLDAIASPLGLRPEDTIFGLVERTRWLDARWMAALDGGVRQFVLLGAGLDARAWRLPRLSASVRVFELDVPAAIAYKEAAVARLALPCRCTRTAVAADLSEAACWPVALLESGFDPAAPSLFLLEGLLQYLPPHAPHALLRAVAGLMAPGSAVVGGHDLTHPNPEPSWRPPPHSS
jgi:methyltransferase (TIGR00027 family)